MLRENIPAISKLVEPDRVHKAVYTDEQLFELEMERIHEKVWVYCGHETQVKNPGDFYTVQIGRQPMVMVRGADGKVNVLYNRCPHRGVMLCGDRHGNTGDAFRCSYHAWTFQLDGKLKNIPMMESYRWRLWRSQLGLFLRTGRGLQLIIAPVAAGICSFNFTLHNVTYRR